MRTITRHTCRCTSKLYKKQQHNKVVNRTLIGNRGHGKNKIMWPLLLLILEHQSQNTTSFMINLTQKHIQI